MEKKYNIDIDCEGILRISTSDRLLERLRGINHWIEGNEGNANMHEIMACISARNNFRIIEGKNELLDDEIKKMIKLRKNSIDEFHSAFPECKKLFDIVESGTTESTLEKMEFISRLESVPFYINDRRKNSNESEYKHDNIDEVLFLADLYEQVSDDIKQASYPIVQWIINNSVDYLKNTVSITPYEEGYAK
jgi:hypothetical protein